MVNAWSLDVPIGKATAINFRINCEFLESCQFRCAGCYVDRKNNFDEYQLNRLIDIIDEVRSNGGILDEIILGPTDFFGALNTNQLLQHPKFRKIFERGDIVITLLSTLQNSIEEIEQVINELNAALTHPDQEIEMLIVFDVDKVLADDREYFDFLKQRIELLEQINPAVDYACQMNIQKVEKLSHDICLESISRKIRNEFNTIVEFNPSFMRSGRPELMGPIVESWNAFIASQINDSNKNDIVVTAANTNHAGLNEITYNYYRGELYNCPFIYENVFDKNEYFRVPRDGEDYTWDDLCRNEVTKQSQQYSYVTKSSDCSTCSQQASCISKDVLYYMEHYNITQCILSKHTLEMFK
jgi:organic radical activating enzyme